MPVFATGAQQAVNYIIESVFGTTPTTPAMTAFRGASCNLDLTRDKFESNELRGDRAITDMRLGTKKVQGDLAFELSSGAFDTFLEACLGGTWTTNVLKMGTTFRSFSIIRRFLDIQQGELFKGCVVDKMKLDFKPNAMVTGTFSFHGQTMEAAPLVTGVYPTGATYPAASAYMPMDAFSGTIQEGGVASAILSSVEFTLENNGEPDYVLGSVIAPVINLGRSKLTGTLSAYFPDLALKNKFLGETESSLSIGLTDGTRTLTFLLPRVKYTGGANPVTNEKSVLLNLPFEALYDTVTQLTNLKVTRS